MLKIQNTSTGETHFNYNFQLKQNNSLGLLSNAGGQLWMSKGIKFYVANVSATLVSC